MAPLAVAAGARLIEKHVTFDKTRQGFDHPISLSADEFATMVAVVRLAEIVLGQPEKIADKSVQQQAKRYQRRLAAAHDLTAGHRLSLEDFLFMRFSAESDAIAAGETDKVIGRELNGPAQRVSAYHGSACHDQRALRIGITASGGDLVPSAFMSLRKNRQLSFEIHAFNAAFAPLSAQLADKFHILPSGEHPDFAAKVMDYLNRVPLMCSCPGLMRKPRCLRPEMKYQNGVRCADQPA